MDDIWPQTYLFGCLEPGTKRIFFIHSILQWCHFWPLMAPLAFNVAFLWMSCALFIPCKFIGFHRVGNYRRHQINYPVSKFSLLPLAVAFTVAFAMAFFEFLSWIIIPYCQKGHITEINTVGPSLPFLLDDIIVKNQNLTLGAPGVKFFEKYATQVFSHRQVASFCASSVFWYCVP